LSVIGVPGEQGRCVKPSMQGKRSRLRALAISLDAELGLPPVPALGVVTDGVASAKADPLRNRAVLLLGLGKLLLGTERLVALLQEKTRQRHVIEPG
jgi:hypothetical protein